jgi:hypothetical protein
MKGRRATVLGLMLTLALVPVARADPPATAQVEINYLLGYVEISGCEFFRNGTWYDSVKAQSHLRDKYNYLKARNRINSAEDFISQAASQSSLSGQPYEVRCSSGCEATTTNQWLRDVLVRYRVYTTRNAAAL